VLFWPSVAVITSIVQIAETFEEEGLDISVSSCKVVDYHNSISYVRFDGQMSAKKRQEAIARFTVPVEDSVTPGRGSTIRPSTKRNVRSTRQSVTTHGRSSNDEDSVTESDSDFSITDSRVQTEDEDDTSTRKGKGKAKGKSSYMNEGDNPRVMLISLKAVTKFPRISTFC
jgi:SWI/SNF-related matrix-associated actin-dependent regulator of chromatin subfamily A3